MFRRYVSGALRLSCERRPHRPQFEGARMSFRRLSSRFLPSRFKPLVLTFLTGAASAGTPGIDLEVTVGTDLSDGACAATSSLDVLVGTEVNFCYRVTNNTATTLEYQSLDDSIE